MNTEAEAVQGFQEGLWIEDVPGGAPPELLVSPFDVARMGRSAREERVEMLIAHSHQLLDVGITEMVGAERTVAGIVGLFSGGNDSHTLVHMMRDRLTHLAHANTGIGIEETREFVRERATAYGLPLIEKSPDPQDSYETQVLDQGFPGPALHYKMYQRLKERALRKVRDEIVSNPYEQRVVFLAGRRREESARRAAVPEFERDGSIVWISPMVLWTKLDLTTYRLMHGVLANPVADKIHMSGECLCGAFAVQGELDEIGFWFPDVRDYIHGLQERVRAVGHPEHLCQWGWGAYRDPAERAAARSGRLCDGCDKRMQASLFDTSEDVA